MRPKERAAVYPGTFDPITYGHIDLIRRGLQIFDRVIVAVAENEPKKPLFTTEERVDMIKKSFGRTPKIGVETFDGLIVEFARKKKIGVLMRGVRMLSDFEYEFQMALTNRKLNNRIETIFLMPNESYAYLTSRLIKETALLGADVRSYVPKHVYERLQSKKRSR